MGAATTPAFSDTEWPETGRRGNDAILKQLITVNKGPTARPYVAMTFDDGPHHTNTPMLLDLLKARDIRATFFVIGKHVARHPDIIKRMVDEGHEIGNHTWSHPNLATLSTAHLLKQLDRTNEAIYTAVRKVPVVMRPPYGTLRPAQARLIHTKRQMVSTLWTVDPRDWSRPGSSVVTSRILSHTHAGSIILAHDIHRPTIRAMPATLDGLKQKGLKFKTVSMLLGARDWNKKRFYWKMPES